MHARQAGDQPTRPSWKLPVSRSSPYYVRAGPVGVVPPRAGHHRLQLYQARVSSRGRGARRRKFSERRVAVVAIRIRWPDRALSGSPST